MSSNVRLLPALVLFVVASAACGGQDPTLAPQPRPASPGPGDSPAAPLETLTIQMVDQNGSGQNGTATLTEEAGKTRVRIELQGAPPGPQPVHIHQGTCANLGAVFKPLTNLEGGKSDTTVDISLADLVAGTYSINAHKSQGEAKVYVSCGQIAR